MGTRPGQALALVGTTTPLRPEPALFDAMLDGWWRQQGARRLSPGIIIARKRTVLRFREFTGCWPWEWRAEQLEAWVAQGAWAHSTIRAYEGSLALFLAYITDPRYGWAEVCLDRVGATASQICHEWNTATHVTEYEGRPDRRPLTRSELQTLFDHADAMVSDAACSARKGWLAAYRDATLLKVIYAWGLRRNEAVMLDVSDFAKNPAAPELGTYGICHVRFAKAMKGSPPRRRAVATVLPWSAEVLCQYVEQVRPLSGDAASDPALWLSERGGRISGRRVGERFAELRRAAKLPSELTVHCLRHSYVSHQIEDGTDPLFVQHQVGHSWASTTAQYTSIGSDHMQRMLRDALDRAFRPPGDRS